jgi:hypothetical protein
LRTRALRASLAAQPAREAQLLSSASRFLAGALAALYALLGAILFVAPEWASANFAWNVSPFVAMTIGGWCLGNAFVAYGAARRWRLSLVASALVYLALFGILETAVAVAFADKLRLGHWLGWLYVVTLAVNVVAVAVWLRDIVVLRPKIEALGRSSGPGELAVGVLFILFVGFLGLYGLFAPPGGRGLNGGIFPEILSPFSLRSFGAFYLAIALTPITLFVFRGVDTVLTHMFLSWPLIFFITLAAFLNIGVFDFAQPQLGA